MDNEEKIKEYKEKLQKELEEKQNNDNI